MAAVDTAAEPTAQAAPPAQAAPTAQADSAPAAVPSAEELVARARALRPLLAANASQGEADRRVVEDRGDDPDHDDERELDERGIERLAAVLAGPG